MIVFKDKKEEFRTDDWIRRIEHCLNTIFNRQIEHDLAVKLLIDCGELECALTDIVCNEEDSVTSTIRLLREMTILAGKIFVQSWENNRIDRCYFYQLYSMHSALKKMCLPEIVPFGVSEGFAFYGLFPETYLETTKKFAQQFCKRPLTIIGLRTIGTTLSAIVSAALTILGYDNTSFTVRPRGEPFDRKIRVSKELESFVSNRVNGGFIITDEGPGLSGSSFGGTAQFLSELGVQDKNIFFFPGWEPDSSMMNSPGARDHWERHPKMSTSFESVWIDSGKLHRWLNTDLLIDLSAGMWRERLLMNSSEIPPVHPHHERRKYLVVKNVLRNDPSTLIKFSGLGRYGEMTFRRAEILQVSGMSLPVKNYENGFIEYEFVEGKHRWIKEITTSFLYSAAKYAAFLKNTFPGGDVVSPDTMREMVMVNIKESIGDAFLDKLSVYHQYTDDLYLKYITAIDGRMQLHKWLQFDNHIIKIDNTDHYHDQFFPGCQDIAWDIAGGIIEWDLNYDQEKYFTNAYIKESGDISVRKRVCPNKIAYCAFRVGISKLFAESLKGTYDGILFDKKYDYYKNYLLKILSEMTTNG
ncbi:MAG: hypothetical protein JW915_02780 [Chitinispirillaceae bacterium]|nr:hypothetical protein [Chitinispirillaceae bacterium]